jgi:glycosyltransferase involved in cell wall biosynthesis
VFVLPSYTENFGIAVVEAMASGLPVVITNKINIWREVAEARAGLVVNCDVHEISSALLTLLVDPMRGKEMGKRGRRLVEKRFTWETVGEQMVQEYREILSRRDFLTAGSQQ